MIVVGSSILRGLDVETHKGLAAIGEAVGLVCAGIGVRRLDRDKRMMPARWGGAPHSQIEQRMHEEHVIGLLKPWGAAESSLCGGSTTSASQGRSPGERQRFPEQHR